MADKAAVIGDGQMGLVLARLLAEKGLEVVLWGPFRSEIVELVRTRKSPRRLPGLALPDSVLLTAEEPEACRHAAVMVDAIPTQFIRPVWSRLAPFVEPGVPIWSVSKGIEQETLLTPLQVLEQVVDGEPPSPRPSPGGRGGSAAQSPPRRPYVCVSGPTIAAELARRLPATMVAASSEPADAIQAQAVLSTPYLRIYTNDDVKGVEIAGAVKNIIAIAAGIVDGLELGYNAKSALLARGLAEIARLGVALGARADTFYGVAGVGDLATTCFCPQGRNRTCGERLGRGESLDTITRTTDSIIEGVATTASVHRLAARLGVDMPITDAVYRILFEGLKPAEALALLMEREAKAER